MEAPTLETPFERSYPLEDIAIRADGDKRTVEAYAAVFNRMTRVTDWYWTSEHWDEYGTYDEVLRAGAFTKTLQERRLDFQSLFNHGKDLYGMPSERFAMPLGTPVEIRQDSKGLVTVTRYSKTELADECLELINDGAVRYMSFGGKMVQSRVTRATKDGDVDLIERIEIALKEYGPCVFPAYTDAKIVGVRAQVLAHKISELGPDQRRELVRAIGSDTSAEAAPEGGTSTAPAPSDPVTPPDTSTEAAPPAPTEGPSPTTRLLELEKEMRERRARL